jgi:hypothetical protein
MERFSDGAKGQGENMSTANGTPLNGPRYGIEYDLAAEYRKMIHPMSAVEIALWRISGDGSSRSGDAGGDVSLLVLTDGPTCLPQVPHPIPCGDCKGWRFTIVSSVELIGGHVAGFAEAIGKCDYGLTYGISDHPFDLVHDQTSYRLSPEAILLITNLIVARESSRKSPS